jgi:hypothetical protein
MMFVTLFSLLRVACLRGHPRAGSVNAKECYFIRIIVHQRQQLGLKLVSLGVPLFLFWFQTTKLNKYFSFNL